MLRVRRAITQALDDLTDHVSFEELVQVLLTDVDPTIRPLGGVGDRGRDAAADLGDGDGAIVSISLEREWSRKIRSEISKIARLGHRPPRVYGVTNRRITRAAEQRLEAFAAERGITLRLLGQQWLATKLLHPQYVSVREDFLHVAPATATVFMNPLDYQELLSARRVSAGFDVALVGRDDELGVLRERLERESSLTVLQGPGGIGKTRLLLELALDEQGWRVWRFIDESAMLTSAAFGELGSGEPMVVVVDNAHRRSDLREVLGLLERRHPRPSVVCVVRPRRLDGITSATASVWLGPAGNGDIVELRPLGGAHIAAMVRSPPFEPSSKAWSDASSRCRKETRSSPCWQRNLQRMANPSQPSHVARSSRGMSARFLRQ